MLQRLFYLSMLVLVTSALFGQQQTFDLATFTPLRAGKNKQQRVLYNFPQKIPKKLLTA